MPSITDYHARYLAHERPRHCASASVEKLASMLGKTNVLLDEIGQRLQQHIERHALFVLRWVLQ